MPVAPGLAEFLHRIDRFPHASENSCSSFPERSQGRVNSQQQAKIRIADNYGTHKHPKVKKWFRTHSRYHVHFTPTSASWLNQVERWFAEITRKRIRRGTFRSVRDLVKAIQEYIRENNKSPRPFQWVASANTIVRKVRKY